MTSSVPSDLANDSKHDQRLSAARHAKSPGQRVAFRDDALANIDDASLAAMLVERDPLAQRIAWRWFAPMVRRMLKRAFGPNGDVDDLVQDVFLVLFLQVSTLREPRALRAFVVSITLRTIHSARRRRAANRVLYVAEPPVTPTAAADVEAREALDRLDRILNRLNAKDRTAFVLRFIERREVSAVSEVLRVSMATTKRRIARAWDRVVVRSRLDSALADYLVGKAPPELSQPAG